MIEVTFEDLHEAMVILGWVYDRNYTTGVHTFKQGKNEKWSSEYCTFWEKNGSEATLTTKQLYNLITAKGDEKMNAMYEKKSGVTQEQPVVRNAKQRDSRFKSEGIFLNLLTKRKLLCEINAKSNNETDQDIIEERLTNRHILEAKIESLLKEVKNCAIKVDLDMCNKDSELYKFIKEDYEWTCYQDFTVLFGDYITIFTAKVE